MMMWIATGVTMTATTTRRSLGRSTEKVLMAWWIVSVRVCGCVVELGSI